MLVSRFWATSLIVILQNPDISITRSSANAWTNEASIPSIAKKVLRVMFQMSGESTPPCGHPLVTFLRTVVSPILSDINLLLTILYIQSGASWVHDGVESLLFLDYPSEPPRGSPRVVPTEGHFLGASLHMGTGPREMFLYTVLHWHDKSVVPLWGHSHQTASLRGIGPKTTQNNSIQLKTNNLKPPGPSSLGVFSLSLGTYTLT